MPESIKKQRSLTMKLLVGVLMATMGFAVTLQIRGSGEDEFGHLRQDELVALLRGVESSTVRVNEQINELTAMRDDLLSSTQRSEQAAAQAQKRADDLAILAGTLPAVGPGITITITDESGAIDSPLLLDAISELRDAGAEAISINGDVRVVAATYFADGDQGPVADGTVLTSPIRILAIGDSNTLRSAVEFPGGMLDRIESRGATMSVVESPEVRITAVAPERRGQHASP